MVCHPTLTVVFDVCLYPGKSESHSVQQLSHAQHVLGHLLRELGDLGSRVRRQLLLKEEEQEEEEEDRRQIDC